MEFLYFEVDKKQHYSVLMKRVLQFDVSLGLKKAPVMKEHSCSHDKCCLKWNALVNQQENVMEVNTKPNDCTVHPPHCQILIQPQFCQEWHYLGTVSLCVDIGRECILHQLIEKKGNQNECIDVAYLFLFIYLIFHY